MTSTPHAPTARRETSSATTRLVLGWVRRHRGQDAVDRVVRAAAVPETVAQLQEPERWTSYDTRLRLFRAVAEEFDDPQVLFEIGASAVASDVGPGMVLLLNALGSPARVYRRAARAVPTFSSTSTMRVLEVGRSSARVDYRLHDGYVHSRLDCLYAQGLLCSVPELFGLPRAEIVHDACESDGAEACLYTLSWPRWSRLRRHRSRTLAEHALRHQVATLQSAAAELVSTSGGVEDALERIVARVATTVVAQGYLLVVTPRDGDEPIVHAVGVAEDVRVRVVADVLAGRTLPPSAVVAGIASARRHYGCLVVLPADGGGSLGHEAGLLAAYAGHAAAALDLVVALEDSRRGEARARALLALSHQLVGAEDATRIAQAVAHALPDVVGSGQAAALLWDEQHGHLRHGASVGLPAELERLLADVVLRPENLPELAGLLSEQRPLVTRADDAAPALQRLLQSLDVDHLLAVPLVAGGELYGVVTASWPRGSTPVEPVLDLVARLQGVGDQAATALRAARLLSTVRHQVLHDSLTELPNRLLFTRRLDEALRRVTSGSGVGVLFCDLDRFKQVNDSLGHAAGDDLLRQIAGRLTAAVEHDHSVSRLSGDEFVVLLPALAHPDAAVAVAQRLVACFEQPFPLEGRSLRVTASIGVAWTTEHGRRSHDLLRGADAAMYSAKQRGRNQVAVAAPTADVREALRPALDSATMDGCTCPRPSRSACSPPGGSSGVS